MKPLLLFVIGMIGNYTTWAVGIQSPDKWRWRNNNGTETSATWKAAVNTLNTAAPLPGIYLLRLSGSTTSETVKLIVKYPLYTQFFPLLKVQFYSLHFSFLTKW